MNYIEMYQEDPGLFFAILFICLGLTFFSYGILPISIAYAKEKAKIAIIYFLIGNVVDFFAHCV